MNIGRAMFLGLIALFGLVWQFGGLESLSHVASPACQIPEARFVNVSLGDRVNDITDSDGHCFVGATGITEGTIVGNRSVSIDPDNGLIIGAAWTQSTRMGDTLAGTIISTNILFLGSLLIILAGFAIAYQEYREGIPQA